VKIIRRFIKKTLFVDLTCPKECNKVSLVQFADTTYYGVLPIHTFITDFVYVYIN